MPVYEEKLISPLCVRFSQEHIRKTFQNGVILEEVVDLVEAKATQEAGGAYDFVLKPPFSNIEIVRWAPTRSMLSYDRDDQAHHWYTKDNRRLYVLQRAATKFWPKKVAIEVDVLFAVPSDLLKRYDSTTAGLLAALGESAHGPSTAIWNWGHAVTPLTGKIDMALEKAAFKQLKRDDLASTLAELLSVPGVRRSPPATNGFSSDSSSTSSEELPAIPEPTALKPKKGEALAQGKGSKQDRHQGKNNNKSVPQDLKETKEQQGAQRKGDAKLNRLGKSGKGRGTVPQESAESDSEESEDSEDSDSEDSDSDDSEESWDEYYQDWSEWWPDFDEHWDMVTTLLDGVWQGPKGESYHMSFQEPGESEVKGVCKRDMGKKSKTFSIRYDYDSCLLWWGTGRRFCLDPEELRKSDRRRARWYVAGKEKPEFDEWLLIGEPLELRSERPPSKGQKKRYFRRRKPQKGAG